MNVSVQAATLSRAIAVSASSAPRLSSAGVLGVKALVAATLASMPAPAWADPNAFVDTRLTVTLGDDDFLDDPEDRRPFSPDVGFGDRPHYQLFYDNLNSRFTGRESITHLVLYREMPGFADDLHTRAALVVRLDADTLTLLDAGSYLELAYRPFSSDPEDGLSLVVFPFDSDRFRLGYLYDLSLGGTDLYLRRSFLGVPGLVARFERGVGSVFVGGKAVPVPTAESGLVGGEVPGEAPVEIAVDQTQYSFLGGGALDLLGRSLRLEVGGGFFQQGRLGIGGYPDDRVYLLGGTARAVYRRHLPIEPSLDTRLYENDPNAPFVAFAPPFYVPGRIGYLFSVEGVYARQHRADPDRIGETTDVMGLGGAARARVQIDYLRLELTGVYRDATFLTLGRAGFVPSFALPSEADERPELFASLSGDYYFPGPRILLGLSGGLKAPAAVTFDDTAGRQTVVLHAHLPASLLEPEDDTSLVISGRVKLRVDLSEMLYALAFIQYTRDPNATRLVQNGAVPIPSASEPHRLGAAVSLAARF